MESIKNIVIIGAGNVGSHLSRALFASGFTISQVAGRKEAAVKALAKEVQASHTLSFDKIITGQDIYLMALPDEVMDEVLPLLPLKDELLVHTSGSVPMGILSPYSENTGVFYPLQTFTSNRDIDMTKVPVMVEANRIDSEHRLLEMGQKLSEKVMVLHSAQRHYMHIAAVFASNFSNHMYEIARQIMEENGLDFGLLAPLIMETAAKATSMGPGKAQTGPASRNDLKIIAKHLEFLDHNDAARELYRRISESIIEQKK